MNSTLHSLRGFQAEFEHMAEGPLAGPPWLQRIRKEAYQSFERLGYPNRRIEEWRYTDVRAMTKQSFHPITDSSLIAEAKLEPFFLFDPYVLRLVFIDGRFSPEFSVLGALPAGVRVGSLVAALKERPEELEAHLGHYADFREQTFVALNTALMRDGAVIQLDPGVVLEHPIHLLYLSTTRHESFATHPRNLIVAERESQVRVVESYAGLEGARYLSNSVTEIVVGPNASVDHYKVQEESLAAYHFGNIKVRQDRDSRFSSHSISLGSALARHDIHTQFWAEGGECHLNGLYVVDGEQHVDHHTLVDHSVPHCTSHENYRGVLDGRSHGVFDGRVIVHPDAQQSEAHQANKNLLLSDAAHVDTKPQLEIYADDVKCSHGATIGQLEEDAVFYLRARGIDEAAARNILTRAFASAVIEKVAVPALRCRIDRLLTSRLPESRAEAGGQEAWTEEVR